MLDTHFQIWYEWLFKMPSKLSKPFQLSPNLPNLDNNHSVVLDP